MKETIKCESCDTNMNAISMDIDRMILFQCPDCDGLEVVSFGFLKMLRKNEY